MTRILCLYTGGTIGCVPSPHGLAPAPGVLDAPIRALAASLAGRPEITLLEYPELLDSSSMGPADWNRIGADIARLYAEFDAFIVLHGTDTLAYTAAALSFQLENLGKPVIVTGAQRPWLQEGSDAPANVASAIKEATTGKPGVRVTFGGKILPGFNARKTGTEHDDDFSAPNWDGSWPDVSPAADFRFVRINPSARIAAFKLYPGLSYDLLIAALEKAPMAGLVLETWGCGNLPQRADLIEAIYWQARRGAVIVNCSQCLTGIVRPAHYAAGHEIARIGAIPAGLMGPETAITKLHYLFGRNPDPASVRAGMKQNLRGEMGPLI
jgi:L-asparaginase